MQSSALLSGRYADAQAIAGTLCSLGDCDGRPGRFRSLVPVASATADIFAKRGEIDTALELSRTGREQIERLPGVESAAIVGANAIEAEILLEAGELEQAGAALRRASAATLVPSAELGSLLPHYHLVSSSYLLSVGAIDAAMAACEQAKAAMIDHAVNPLTLAKSYLQCSKVQLARGDAEGAWDEASIAWQLIDQAAGVSNHLRYEHRLMRATVLMHEESPYAALEEVAAARREFDPSEVLYHRLAMLDFVEAQLHWMIDSSASGRASALRTGERALERSRTWDRSAQHEGDEVEQWINAHRLKNLIASPF